MTGAAVTFATQVLLARWMGAEQLGIYTLAFSWLTILAVFSIAGLNGSAIRFIGDPLAKGDFSAITGFLRRSRQITAGLSILIALIMIALVMNGVIGDPDEQAVYLIAFSALPIYSAIVLYSGITNAFSWFATSFMPNNVLRPLLFFFAVAVVWWLTEALDAVVAMSIHLVIIVVVGVMVVLWCERGINQIVPADSSSPRFESRHWVKTSIPIMFMTLFSAYFPAFTVIIAGTSLSNEDIAIYNVGYRVALLVSFGLLAVDAYASPEMMKLFALEKLDELKALTNRVTRLRFIIALVAMFIFVTMGQWILGIFGPEFVHGYEVLLLLGLTQLVMAAIGPVVRLLGMTGHQDQGLYVSVFALACAALLLLVLTPLYGLPGTASAAFAAIAIWCAGLSQIVKNRLGFRPTPF